MKKTLIILILSLGFCINNAQAQEPTKQETMDWIAGKIEKYLVLETDWRTTSSGKEKNYTNSFNKYSEGVIFINSKANYSSGRSYDNNIIIDLNKIESVVIESVGFAIKGTSVSFQFNEWQSGFYFVKSNNTGIEPLLSFNAEPDLFNRMLKAFQALAKFNNADKPKEKY